jgi:serine protease Do
MEENLKSVDKGSFPRRTGVPTVVWVAIVFLTIGFAISAKLDFTPRSRAVSLFGERGIESRSGAQTHNLPNFVELSKRLSPAVVNISTTQPRIERRQREPWREEDDPFDFWRRFFGGPYPSPRTPFRQKSLGSGFIIDKDGSILTNNHVVQGAEKIVVKLSDNKEYEAKVIGGDTETDIAVIKIQAPRDLPVAELGNSDKLDVGEWVLAIGNPFGLDHTVTSGIISAKGRQIGGRYDNFIQTDASINPGNSGGPLINLNGQVIGINTMIFSRTGGNMGIGFAIPVNLVKDLLPQIRGKGKVTRGWMGVMIQPVTQEVAESLDLKEAAGALVGTVMKGSPAERAGVQVGDVITEFDGKPVKNSSELPTLVARTPVNKRVELKVTRDKVEKKLFIIVAEMKEEEQTPVAEVETEKVGLTVQKLTPEIAESLGMSSTEGVVVSGVEQNSLAEEAGFRRGDVVVEINRKPIRSIAEYRRGIQEMKKAKSVLFLVRRGNNTIFLALKGTG